MHRNFVSIIPLSRSSERTVDTFGRIIETLFSTGQYVPDVNPGFYVLHEFITYVILILLFLKTFRYVTDKCNRKLVNIIKHSDKFF